MVTRNQGVALTVDQKLNLEEIMKTHIEAVMGLYEKTSERNDNDDVSADLKLFRERFGNLWMETYHKYTESGLNGKLSIDLLQATVPSELERPPSGLLYSSLLISTVSMCEVFLAQAMREYLRFLPQALHGTEIRFQFADMQQFDSIESLKEFHIDRQVDNVIRQGGIDEWMKWFEGRVKISFAQVATDPAALRETFQRRHLHVHNDGTVSAVYLAKMSDMKGGKPSLGAYLRVDEDYLLAAVDRLRIFGIALAVVLTRKLTPKAAMGYGVKQLEGYASDLVYGLLCAGKHGVVVELANLVLEGMAEQSTRTIMLVNRWIAESRLGREKKVHAEVKAWDTSALDPNFRLAQLTLLGKVDEAYPLLKTQIERGSLTENNYREWPLFAPLREVYPVDLDLDETDPLQGIPPQREEAGSPAAASTLSDREHGDAVGAEESSGG